MAVDSMPTLTEIIARIERCKNCLLALNDCCTHKKSTAWEQGLSADFGHHCWVWMVGKCPERRTN
jgi:hypothetical protein